MAISDSPAHSHRASRRAPFIAALALFVLAAACGDDGAARGGTARRAGSAQVGGQVVSTVDGHPITVADVEALVRASSLTPREALERLQDEQLLMIEAARRGVSGPTIDLVAERAIVQALLELEVEQYTPSESELRAAYRDDPRFHATESRKSEHVLVKFKAKTTPPEDVEAARLIAVQAIRDMASLDFEALKARYDRPAERLPVKAESLPPAPQDAPLVKPYLDAIFSLKAPGIVPEPVRTNFGWHAIRVTEIVPPHDVPYEEVAPVLREEMTLNRRTELATSLLTELRRGQAVQVVKDVDDKLSLVDSVGSFRGR